MLLLLVDLLENDGNFEKKNLSRIVLNFNSHFWNILHNIVFLIGFYFNFHILYLGITTLTSPVWPNGVRRSDSRHQ